MNIHRWIRVVCVLVFALGAARLAPAAEKGAKSERRASKTDTAATARVDINTADVATLETLPGVGRTTAEAIVKTRPFASVNDLERVPGIGPSRLEDLRDRVTVSGSGARGKGSSKKSPTATEKASKRSTETPSAKRDEGESRRPKEGRTSAKVDVNTAGIEELESLPGVGPQTAKAIVAGRPFRSIDDLERVPGIGAARLEELRDRVTVSSRSSTTTATTQRRETIGEQRERDLEPTGRTSGASREPAATGGRAKVNLNTATLEELEALPEIGPVRARAIIEARPFKSVDDLTRVKGIKDIRLEELRPHVTVR